DLAEYGEIARLDASLAVIARCILVTYFDVRCAQRLMLSGLGRCEPFPPARTPGRFKFQCSYLFFALGFRGLGFSFFIIGSISHCSCFFSYYFSFFYQC
ncbi:unnamed protein product, partial [Symbiodinium microadriaticum]